jgi:hypothetical protein
LIEFPQPGQLGRECESLLNEVINRHSQG